MLQRWGFSCTCSLCSAAPSATAVSDANRERLEELEMVIDEYLQNGTGIREAIEMTHTMLGLLEEEDMLMQFRGEQYEVLARCHRALGENQEAERYARMYMDDLHRVPELSSPVGPGAVEAFLKSFDDDI
jgi:hypothetical protein